MNHPNKAIMQKIINLAKRKRSVACIIVKDNKIIAQAITTIFTEYQPFRHAEINTIEKACKKLKTFDLKNCWLYTTYEPCPMCASAIVWANIKGVVYGASMKDRNKVYTQKILIPCKTVLKHGTPKVKLYEKFMEKECKKLLLL